MGWVDAVGLGQVLAMELGSYFLRMAVSININEPAIPMKK